MAPSIQGPRPTLYTPAQVAEWWSKLFRKSTDTPLVERLDELVLGGQRRYTRLQMAEMTGVSPERGRLLWRAIGFADVGDDDIVFTDADVAAARMLNDLVGSGVIDPGIEMAVVRSVGQALSNLASWEAALLSEYVASFPTDQHGDVAEQQVLQFAETVLPVLNELHSYTWRRHLSALLARANATENALTESWTLVVGFADLEGYTRLSRNISESELAALLERFDSVAANVIARAGGRVVKTLGDEVMFTADTPTAAAVIALGLLDAIEDDGEIPNVGIGMAYGRVLRRFGDVYGPVVNVASRLTSIAKPGVILVEAALAAALEGEPGIRLRRRRSTAVRGYSHLASWRLTASARSAGRRSATDVDGFALLEEGGDAFFVIFGGEQFAEPCAHPLAELVPIGVERQRQPSLQCRHRQRGVGRDLVRQRHRGRQEVFVIDDPRDQPDPLGLAGVDDPPGEQQLGRMRTTDQLVQPRHAGDVAAQAALDEQFAELGPLRRDADVGHHRHLHPPADGRPVDGRDDRHVGSQQHPGRRCESGDPLGVGQPIGRADHHLLHVVATTERRIAAGEHETPGGRGRHGPGQLVVGGERQCVAGVGTVDRDDADPVLFLVANFGVHGHSLTVSPSRPHC